MASTMITRFELWRKVRCHKGDVEIPGAALRRPVVEHASMHSGVDGAIGILRLHLSRAFARDKFRSGRQCLLTTTGAGPGWPSEQILNLVGGSGV